MDYGNCINCNTPLRYQDECLQCYTTQPLRPKTTINQTTEDDYMDMLGCLPPLDFDGRNFLVSEAVGIRGCRITSKLSHTYNAFFSNSTQPYHKASDTLTRAEFRHVLSLMPTEAIDWPITANEPQSPETTAATATKPNGE